jgi:hypothetical protein
MNLTLPWKRKARIVLGTIVVIVPSSNLGSAETIGPSSDDTSAINAVLSKGGQAMLVNSGTPYVINDTLVFAAGAELSGQHGTVIAMTAPKLFFRIPPGAYDVKIRDITFDGTRLHGASPAIPCYGSNFSWIGGGMHYGAPLFLLPGCDGALIQRVKITFSSAGAVNIHGANRVQVRDSEFENNVGFGIWVTEGSSAFKLSGNWSNLNGIEMIGVTYSAHHGEIVRNHVSGSGDNCISVSGTTFR